MHSEIVPVPPSIPQGERIIKPQVFDFPVVVRYRTMNGNTLARSSTEYHLFEVTQMLRIPCPNCGETFFVSDVEAFQPCLHC
jgi:hypothetical protein